MAFKIDPLLWETSTTTGTGNLTLAGAVTNYRAFSAALSNNDTTWYAVRHRDNPTTEWEEGTGTWTTGNVFVRTTILKSSNANAAVSFSAGTKDVICTLPSTILDQAVRAADSPTFAGLTIVGGGVTASSGFISNVASGSLRAGLTTGGTNNGNILVQASDQFPGIFFRSGTTTKTQLLADASGTTLYIDAPTLNIRDTLNGGTTRIQVTTSGVTIGGSLTVHSITSSGATGTGSFVFNTSPVLVTPTIGSAFATAITIQGDLTFQLASRSIVNTAPTAASASQAGFGINITASAATAGTSSAGAAAGGSIVLTSGAAARLTSGNANGGDISLIPGIGIGTGTPGSALLTINALGATSTVGLLIGNTTAAAAGAQQYSPYLRWKGSGWKTDVTAASQLVEFRSYVVPVQGAAAPTGLLTFDSAINGGSFANAITFGTTGDITTAGNHIFSGTSAGTASTVWVGGTSSGLYLNAPTSSNVRIGINNSDITTVTSTGVSVTGTLSASGTFTSTKDGNQFIRSGATVNQQYWDVANTSGRMLLGIEGSSTGTLMTGSTAYGVVLNSVSNTAVEIGVNNTKILSITSSAVTSTVSATLGTATSTSTATPLTLNMGGTFSNAAGTSTKSKLQLFNDGTSIYGLGVASNSMEFFAPSTAALDFYVGTNKALQIGVGGIQKRVTSTTSSGTPTPNADTTDLFLLTAQAATAAFANPTGTPVQGQPLMIRIKDNGTARSTTWGTAYRASSDLALPTTTIISKTLYLGFIYNGTDSKWDLMASLNNF